MSFDQVIPDFPGEIDAFRLLPRSKIPCLEDGYVSLIDCMPRLIPPDRTLEVAIVQSARISTGNGLKDKTADDNLVRYLYRESHTSPFESVKFTFHIRCPIFVRTQLIRHRTANINEFSQRYSVIKDSSYYSPLESEGFGLRIQSRQNKQSSSSLDSGETRDALTEKCQQAEEHVEALFAMYEELIKLGMARETARAYLPVATYTELYFTMDLHNLLKFLRLRMDSHTQAETRVFAQAMHDLILPLVPVALDCFHRYSLGSLTLSAHEIEAISQRKRKLEGTVSESEKRGYEAKLARLNLQFPEEDIDAVYQNNGDICC